MADEKNSANSYKKISNPLTIIGLFAGIAEVAGTAVLPLISEPLQKFFIFYVMGFPVLLVLLFFRTLNKNPKVLYAPSDFSDESNFMQLLLKEADEKVKEISEKNPDISDQLKPVQELITSATDVATVTNKNQARIFASELAHRMAHYQVYSLSEDELKIIESIISCNEKFEVEDIVELSGLQYGDVASAINKWINEGLILRHKNDNGTLLSLRRNIEVDKAKHQIIRKMFRY